MKKTAAKTTASKPAPAAKAAAAKKPVSAAAPAKKAAPASKPAAPAVKTVAPAIKTAAPAIKKTPAPKKPSAPEKTGTAAALIPQTIRTTTIVAAIDVGFGNTLTIRGEGAGLSWESGSIMECASGDRWTVTLAETTHPIVCKFLVNDDVWSTGEDYTVLPGSSVVLSPTF